MPIEHSAPAQRLRQALAHRGAILPVVAGLALFTVAIASSWSQNLDCAQPNADGCPLELDQSVAAVMMGDTLIHRWRIQVPAGSDGTANLWVTMPAPPADFDLYVANAAGALVGRSIEDGPTDESVHLSNVAPGTYVAVVISPRCVRSSQPYLLIASARQGPGLAPVAQAADAPAIAPDLATLLGSGIGSCAATGSAPPAVNPYGAAPADVNPYVAPPEAPAPPPAEAPAPPPADAPPAL